MKLGVSKTGGPGRGGFECPGMTTRGGAPAHPRRDDMRWSKEKTFLQKTFGMSSELSTPDA